jgi:nicotinate-nucleotide pyrophosphorylase (carboxylating)
VTDLEDVVARALAEDLGPDGDVTTLALVPEDAAGSGRFVAKAPGVVAGTAAASEAFRQVDPGVAVRWEKGDGGAVGPGDVVGTVEGLLRSILTGERTALNLLCHLSGVATLTRAYVDAARSAGSTVVLDTRKTLPGLRALEKAAVVAGGGRNHRFGLSDAVLVKDNHLVSSGITDAVDLARARWPALLVEIECDTLEQVAEGVEAGADRLLLDNMTPDQVREAVELVAGRVPIEVSGGVTVDNVSRYAAAGADFVSVGALTHSAPALDVSLDVARADVVSGGP